MKIILNNLSGIPFCTVMFGVNSVLGIFEKNNIKPRFFVVDICKDVLGNVCYMNKYSILLSILCINLLLYQTETNWIWSKLSVFDNKTNNY